MINYILLGVSIVLGAIGQIGLKYAATVDAPRLSVGPKLFNEYLAFALALYLLSVLLYTLSLREIALSVAYPSVSLSYVFVAYMSSVIWGTAFGFREISALVLIMLAIGLLVTGK